MWALASPLVWKLIGGLVVVAVIGGGISYWSVHQYNKGWNAAIASVAAQDQEAVDAVNKATSNIADCTNSGGVWRSSSGKCERR